MVGIERTQRSTVRLWIGLALVVLPMLGLIHIFAGQPTDSAGKASAGGLVGQAIGTPMAVGFSAYLAVPLLLLAIVYGALQLTGLTVKQIYTLAADFLGVGSWRGGSGSDDYDDYEDHANDVDEDDQYGHVDRQITRAARRTPMATIRWRSKEAMWMTPSLLIPTRPWCSIRRLLVRRSGASVPSQSARNRSAVSRSLHHRWRTSQSCWRTTTRSPR